MSMEPIGPAGHAAALPPAQARLDLPEAVRQAPHPPPPVRGGRVATGNATHEAARTEHATPDRDGDGRAPWQAVVGTIEDSDCQKTDQPVQHPGGGADEGCGRNLDLSG
jgi:hypothetical protein